MAVPKWSESLAAETQWFHIFKAMIDSGELARLEGSAIKVYLVVKAYANFSTGFSFPALETVAEKAGLSLSQVQRCLKNLQNNGYIRKEKKGRNNVYTLREKVQIKGEGRRPAAVATWDYLPGSVTQAVADLKRVLITGDLAGAQVVHIERLQVNVTHLHDNAANFNVQDFYASLNDLPPRIAERLREGYETSQRRAMAGAYTQILDDQCHG
ncbi:helix-turn-helix domain-containing protein [Achromobacter dolens]|uniref:helix-turn-helix domain-containing protein n=1 Tax=Achromobacter dolens TaxID=1287738 RepID=UPI003557F806